MSPFAASRPGPGRRRVHTLRLAGPLCVLLGLAAACDDVAVGDDTEVFGVIRDACTERGLVGADVSFSSDTGEAASAISGGDGRYQIRITTRSPFGQLRAAREGYTADQRAVHFDRGSRNVDLSLVPSDGCPLR